MKLTSAMHTFALISTLASAPGCLVNNNDMPDSRLFDEMNVVGDNLDPKGVELQGVELQGVELQGVELQGVELGGARLKGVNLSGASIVGNSTPQHVSIEGGELVVIRNKAVTNRGEQLEGTVVQGVLTDDSTVGLRIDDVQSTADPEIYEYAVTYWNGSSWANLCGESNGTPVRALALAGRWDLSSGTATGGAHIDDPGMFTFACKNAVIAKCVGMGYVPWRTVQECYDGVCQTIEMRDMHLACTRMMRADYCGDGTSHTQNGTMINVWDNFEIQSRDTVVPVNWTDEAEWSPSGAVCIQQVRWSGTAEGYIGDHCPERWVSTDFDCFSSDSTFFSAEGFATPIANRSVLRNQFTHDPQ